MVVVVIGVYTTVIVCTEAENLAILYHSLPYIHEVGSLTEPGDLLCFLALLATNEHSVLSDSVSSHHYWRHRCTQPHPAFNMSARDSNLGPYTCMASTLTQ